jgi:NitT/TauT family transport system ATP-binding protein
MLNSCSAVDLTSTIVEVLPSPAVPALNNLQGREADGVSILGVSKRYDGPSGLVTALDSIDLDVARGTFVSIIGPSGCGKSTLLRIVAGLTPSDAGKVAIFRESVGSAQKNKHIGFVPQSLGLLPWLTALENVRLASRINRHANRPARDPAEILDAFGLREYVDYRPSELSGGMRQRVAIARAFALDPELLVMDEPFASLDELTREVLRIELLDLWQASGTTVLFVTHSVSEAVLLSDEVVVMAPTPGRVNARIAIDLDRPRSESVELSGRFRALEAEVRVALRGGPDAGGRR